MYDFDKIVKRRNTKCIKWDTWKKEGKPKDILPLWVADMDFETLPEVTEAIIERAKHAVYGYSMAGDDYYEAVCNWMKRRHQLDINADNIVTTTGVVTALKNRS